jgi:hypothetical protein
MRGGVGIRGPQKPLHGVTLSGFYVSNKFGGNRNESRSNEFRCRTNSDGVWVTILDPREDSITTAHRSIRRMGEPFYLSLDSISAMQECTIGAF